MNKRSGRNCACSFCRRFFIKKPISLPSNCLPDRDLSFFFFLFLINPELGFSDKPQLGLVSEAGCIAPCAPLQNVALGGVVR